MGRLGAAHLQWCSGMCAWHAAMHDPCLAHGMTAIPLGDVVRAGQACSAVLSTRISTAMAAQMLPAEQQQMDVRVISDTSVPPRWE